MGEEPFYSVFDHTADLGLEVWGDDASQLFVNAARAMFRCVTGGSEEHWTDGGEPVTVEANAPDMEALLVRWLSELLFLFTVEGWVFSRYEIAELSPERIRATAYAVPYDTGQHGFEAEVKAVTYHRLRIERTEQDGVERWTARVVLDV